MTQFVTLCLLVGYATADFAHVARAAETGTSTQFRNEDFAGNYNFGYDEDHSSGGSFRRETGNALGVKVGSYGLRDADGRVRVVNYVADAHGFRASVATNEPGTVPSAPADVSIGAPGAALPPAAVPVARPAPPVAVQPAVPVAAPGPVFNAVATPAARVAYADPRPVHYNAAPAAYAAPTHAAYGTTHVGPASYGFGVPGATPFNAAFNGHLTPPATLAARAHVPHHIAYELRNYGAAAAHVVAAGNPYANYASPLPGYAAHAAPRPLAYAGYSHPFVYGHKVLHPVAVAHHPHF